MAKRRDYVAEGAASRPPIIVDYDLQFRQPQLGAALAYWRSRCRDRAMPARADLDPIDMREFLANVLLAEVVVGRRDPQLRMRLAGTAIEAIFGPMTGKPLAEALPPDMVSRWALLAETVLAARGPVRFVTRIAYRAQEFVTAEALAAPLSGNGTDIDMMFAVVLFTTGAED